MNNIFSVLNSYKEPRKDGTYNEIVICTKSGKDYLGTLKEWDSINHNLVALLSGGGSLAYIDIGSIEAVKVIFPA